MKKGLFIAYRLIGTLISLMAYMFLFFVLAAIFEKGLQNILILSLFLAACLVIYSALNGMFSRMVLLLQQPIRRSLKDWIKVNAYVWVIYSGLSIICCLVLVANPSIFRMISQQQPGIFGTITEQQLRSLMIGNLILMSIVLTHCIWTLRLVKRFGEYFQEL